MTKHKTKKVPEAFTTCSVVLTLTFCNDVIFSSNSFLRFTSFHLVLKEFVGFFIARFEDLYNFFCDHGFDHLKKLSEWVVDDRVRPSVIGARFGAFLDLSLPKHDHALLSSFVEHYDLSVEYLGENLCEGDTGAIKLDTLKNKFQNVPVEIDRSELTYYIRAYLLYVLGTTILPDKSGSLVPTLFMVGTKEPDWSGNIPKIYNRFSPKYFIDNWMGFPSPGNSLLVNRQPCDMSSVLQSKVQLYIIEYKTSLAGIMMVLQVRRVDLNKTTLNTVVGFASDGSVGEKLKGIIVYALCRFVPCLSLSLLSAKVEELERKLKGRYEAESLLHQKVEEVEREAA
ncbi:hypothetical protein RHSIM_Rhsim02G0019100 [Rhododendron simsii]|uniref:Uncharacterized protein n=1 Tax=Rhododendron simsii TaxID=118357 RepID=A0A834LTG0_RHOSS|nr:hypothetical protein RHSIM_Rhsim02G0019100 [Rhododendron simsii]